MLSLHEKEFLEQLGEGNCEDLQEDQTRWRGVCGYDGGHFKGWQSQAGGGTVQDWLEARAERIFKRPIRIHGSGRTDSGVHARAQVFHFDACWGHDRHKLLRAFRAGNPRGINILCLKPVEKTFHARYSATGKRYIYRYFEGYPQPWEAPYVLSLERRKLDTEAMSRAAGQWLGTHDFSAFGAMRGDGSEDDPVKTMWRMEVRREGRRVSFITEGSGYLYKMVRSFAGFLLACGLGKVSAEEAGQLLRGCQRTEMVETALAHGLWLDHVFYRRRARVCETLPS